MATSTFGKSHTCVCTMPHDRVWLTSKQAHKNFGISYFELIIHWCVWGYTWSCVTIWRSQNSLILYLFNNLWKSNHLQWFSHTSKQLHINLSNPNYIYNYNNSNLIIFITKHGKISTNAFTKFIKWI